MELSFQLIEQIFCLFLMGVAGFVLAKSGLVDGPSCRPVSTICVYIFVPCMIFGGFLIEWTHDRVVGMVVAFLAACVIHLVFLLAAELLRKPLGLSEIDCSSLAYTNAGNLLIPLIVGTLGEEYIFYCCSYMVAQNLLLWGWTAPRIGGQKGFRLDKLLKNPTIIAIALGFVFMLFPIHLPAAIVSTIKSVGNCMAPASMVMVGILMAGIKITGSPQTKGSGKVMALRLGVFPFITLAVLLPLALFVDHPDIWQICFVYMLAGSGPSASQVPQVAQLYGVDAERASYLNSVTTLLCSFTLPLASMLALWVLPGAV